MERLLGNTKGLMPPVVKGEVRNPAGINQWTYRAEAEKDLERWCRKHGRDLIEKVLNLALEGKPWALKLMLDRIMPVVHRHEIELPHVEQGSLEAALDRFLTGQAGSVSAKPNGDGKAAA
jgi:hypothetical protein